MTKEMVQIERVAAQNRIKSVMLVLWWLFLIIVIQLFELFSASKPISVSDGYYLNFLKSHSDLEWHDMWQNLWDLSPSVTIPRKLVDIYGSEQKAADKVIEHISSYAFWVDSTNNNGQYSYKCDLVKLTVTGITYFPNALEMQECIAGILDETLSLIQHGDDPLNTAAAINEYLSSNVSYGSDSITQGQTVYSALVERQALCSGFSRTFNTLALLLGVDSKIVIGYLENKQGEVVRHAWNALTVDTDKYFIDTTVNATGISNWVINVPIKELYEKGYTFPELHAEGIYLIK